MLLALIFGFLHSLYRNSPSNCGFIFLENPMRTKAFIQIISMGIDTKLSMFPVAQKTLNDLMYKEATGKSEGFRSFLTLHSGLHTFVYT